MEIGRIWKFLNCCIQKYALYVKMLFILHLSYNVMDQRCVIIISSNSSEITIALQTPVPRMTPLTRQGGSSNQDNIQYPQQVLERASQRNFTQCNCSPETQQSSLVSQTRMLTVQKFTWCLPTFKSKLKHVKVKL